MIHSSPPGADSVPRDARLVPAPHASRAVAAGGLNLHYLDSGTTGKPPMLCVHGGAAHAHWFDFFAPGFIADHHVRSLDLRGHGDSAWADPPEYGYERYAADIAGAVDALGLAPFTLVAHSMGGMVSVLYAATHAGRVARLVIMDSLLRMTDERVATLRGVGTREGSSYASRDEFVAGYRLRPAGTTAAPEVLAHLAAVGGREGPDGRWRHKFDRNVYARRSSFDVLPYWGRLHIPVLLLKGERSPRLSPQVVGEIRAVCPQLEFEEIPGSDHHVTLDNPDACIAAVRAFLARHP